MTVSPYFLQVGGRFFDIALNNMNNRGRVSLCGAISTYNIEGDAPKGIFSLLSTVNGHIMLAWSVYTIPKIKLLCNLSCLKARFRLLCNKLSMAQPPEPRFKAA